MLRPLVIDSIDEFINALADPRNEIRKFSRKVKKEMWNCEFCFGFEALALEMDSGNFDCTKRIGMGACMYSGAHLELRSDGIVIK